MEPASQLGRYRLIAELAHGGMGDVYLGVAQGPGGFNKLMVIKQLRPALAEDEQFLAMFLEEARLAARLNHPNVVQTVEVGSEGRDHFLAMEYLEGQSLQRLRTRIAKDRPFPLGPHLRILVEVCAGLHYAHELVDIDNTPLGIVHRDVTPHNLFVTYEGRVKVVDFGIAKAMDSSLETRTGELKGKIAYMPPEQASAQRVDRRADVFAVGVMIWEAAVGRRLWKGMNELAIMHQLMNGAIPSPRSVDPRVPPELDRICQKAMATSPDDRYATAADLSADLERFLVSIGDRTTHREIAKLVGDAFETDRKEMREIIDAQLRGLRAEPGSSGPVPVPRIDLTGTRTPSVSGVPRPSATQMDTGAAPSFTAGGTAASTQPSTPRRTSLVIGAVMTVAAVGLLAVAVAVGLHRSSDTPAAGAASAATSTPPTTTDTDTTAPPHVDVTFTANPADAKLTLDDAPLEGNPFTGAFPRDGLAHRVRAEAKGYLPRTEIVVFDKDAASVSLTLPKATVIGGPIPGWKGPHHGALARTPATSTKPAASVDPLDANKKPPKRQIDTNPFGKP